MVPPGPVQASTQFVAVVIAVIDCEPKVALDPLHPPDAAQELALALDQVSVDAPPDVTDVGNAASVTVGGGVPALAECL